MFWGQQINNIYNDNQDSESLNIQKEDLLMKILKAEYFN